MSEYHSDLWLGIFSKFARLCWALCKCMHCMTSSKHLVVLYYNSSCRVAFLHVCLVICYYLHNNNNNNNNNNGNEKINFVVKVSKLKMKMKV